MASNSRSRSRGGPPPGAAAIPAVAIGVSVLLGLAALYFGFPGTFLVWVGLLVASWTVNSPELTGKDLVTKAPVPQGPREEAQYRRYRFFSRLKWSLVIPTAAVWPGWPIFAAWLGGLLLAVSAWSLPHFVLPGQYPAGILRHVDFVFTLIVVTQVAAARRETVVSGDRSPGVRLDSLLKMGETPKATRIILGVCAVAALVVSYALGTTVPGPDTLLPGFVSDIWWYVLGAALGVSAVIARPWTDTALAHWREVVAARAEWEPRWTMLKHNNAPRLLDREHVGKAVIDSFTADGSMGSNVYLALGPKVLPTMGSPVRIAMLPMPSKDASGQPQPGTISPLDFKIVAWPNDYQISLADPDVDPEEAQLWLSCALAWGTEGLSLPPMVDEMVMVAVGSQPEESEPDEEPETDDTDGNNEDDQAVSVPAPEPAAPPEPTGPSAAVWMVSLHMPAGPGLEILRKQVSGALAGHCQCESLVSHRPPRKAIDVPQGLYLGALTQGAPDIDAESGVTHQGLINLNAEDEWNTRHAAVLKNDVNPPTIDHSSRADATLPGGQVIERQGFITRVGVDPQSFFPHVRAYRATLSGAPFLAINGWRAAGGRPGERHAQAFSITWSKQPVPDNPDALPPLPTPPERERPEASSRPGRGRRSARGAAPTANNAHTWLLAGRVNEAFQAARLAQPECYEVRCLTTSRSPRHIWEMKIRLHGGVTLADVRGASQRLRQHWGSEWLRVGEAPDGVVIVAGGHPRRVRLADPADEAYLVSLNWQQAWLDAKVSGSGGLTPNLIEVDHLPKNDKVEVITFSLPSGLDYSSVKEASAKLEAATGNAFVDVRKAASGKASEITILACEVSPMPERASMEWDEASDEDHRIPFATALTGESVRYDNRVDAHLLVSGVSGGGKAQKLTAAFPVPVSERFPTGWATNGDLVEGDLVYAADGTTAIVTGFSPVVTEPVYKMTLSDGQVVESGAHHLWKVSTRKSRSLHRGKVADRRARRLETYTDRAADLRATAAQVGPTHLATLPEIARVLDMSETGIHNYHLPLRHLAVAMQIPTGKKSRVFDVEAVADHFLVRHAAEARLGKPLTFAGWTVLPSHIEGLRTAGAQMDGWLTTRAMTDALLGHEASRAERALMSQVLRRNVFLARQGQATMTVSGYPVDEVLNLLADHIEHLSDRSDSGRVVQSVETILNTSEILDAGMGRGFAIRRPTPLDGPDLDLPVDPYVLGVWLGDGHSYSGFITQATSETCTDASGLTDQDHVRIQVSQHYACYPLPSNPDTVLGTRGLATDLRAAGVLKNKHIPAGYLRASADQRLALLQGLMDTDGSVNESGQCELDLCDKRLADGALELLRTFGVFATQRAEPATITEPDPEHLGSTRQRVTGTRYRLKFTTDLTLFRMPRKVARLRATGSLRSTQDWLYIESVEIVEPAPMRCIAIDHPSHLYLTDGFVPTHNSVALQNFIYGALARGWDLYVIDPAKGAVDFNFAEPFARAVARDAWQAQGTIKAIYAEVMRRKAINSAYNCGNYRDLPDEVRYPHVLIVMDEFTSLMIPEPTPKAATDDPEVLAEIANAVAMNSARAFIGTFTGKIVREARSTGFTVLLATQALKADTLSKIPGANDLKDNMSRMIVGRASSGQLAAALKMPYETPPQPTVLPPGRGLYEGNGRPSEVIQVWFEGSQQVFSDHVLESRQPLLDEERLDLTGFVAPQMEIEGGFIDDESPVVLPEASTAAPGAPGFDAAPASTSSTTEVDLGDMDLSSFSLDDLEMIAVQESDGAVESTQPPPVTATSPPAFDWDAATAAAQASADAASTGDDLDWGTPDDDNVDDETPAAPPAGAEELDWDPVPEPTPSTEPAQPEQPADPAEGQILVEDDIDWDLIDPASWEPTESAYGWTEIDALMGFLDDFPAVASVTWRNERLNELDESGVAYVDFVADLLAERDVDFTGPERAPETDGPAPLAPPAHHTPVQPTPTVVAAPPEPAASYASQQTQAPQKVEDYDDFDSRPRLPAHLLPAQSGTRPGQQ